ncbi:nuclease-related domain-containing protein [Pseudarthrobacter sp. N5]|uniref:nuclease-related domain-containing protein n=1 Tax=Pseudarthrobacter sp. N5 TaxID=3418416 RepID=UPI003CED980F
MGAGDGAAEQSRLAAERVARLKRQLDHAERAADSWGAGAAGERLVADRLSQLIPKGWFLLHDVHWPGRPLANLDHVLVGPGGVVVVDTKNWTGAVEVSAGVLRQNGRGRHQSVEGALGQAAAVAAILAVPHRQFVQAVICLAGHPETFGRTADGVTIVGLNTVVSTLAALPDVLDQQTVMGLYSHLGQQLTQDQTATGTHGRSGPPATTRRRSHPATTRSQTSPARTRKKRTTAGNPQTTPAGCLLSGLTLAGLVALLIWAASWLPGLLVSLLFHR